MTILERALFELHHEALQSDKVSGMALLRDLLQSSKHFGNLLPRQVMPFFRTLFLPQGLNLRNLYWHGFLTPAATCRNYTALLIHILVSLTPCTKLERIRSWSHCRNEQDARLESVKQKPFFENVTFDHCIGFYLSRDVVLACLAYLLDDDGVIAHIT